MIHSIKTFQFVCDLCKATAQLETHEHHNDQPRYGVRPPEWVKKESDGWGMTDYTRTLDLCPACADQEV
jgi:hypothetical protein